MTDACAFPCNEGGTQILFPVADAGLVLRYIEYKTPDFNVMYNHERWNSPTTASRFDTGTPDPRAQFVYEIGLTGERAIRICKWSPRLPAQLFHKNRNGCSVWTARSRRCSTCVKDLQ